MEIGVIADTHDNYYNTAQAVKLIAQRNITTCIHLGDFCAPGFIRRLLGLADLSWVCVWGNIDGAKAKILLEQAGNPKFDIQEEAFREYEFDGVKTFLTHYPLLAKIAAKSGDYKAVFYGDNHIKFNEVQPNGTLLANPGEIAGFKTGFPSFGIWETTANTFEIIDLKDFIVAK